MKDYLYNWLESRETTTHASNGERTYYLVKVPAGMGLSYIYGTELFGGHTLQASKMEYLGVYKPSDGHVYDVDYSLSHFLPDDYAQNERSMMIARVQNEITAEIARQIEANKPEWMLQEARREALERSLNEIATETAPSDARISYIRDELPPLPMRVPIWKRRDRPETVPLEYIKDPRAYVEMEAKKRLDDPHLCEYAMCAVTYNDAAKTAYANITADPQDPVHVRRRVVKAMRDSDAKNVNVTISEYGGTTTVKCDTAQLVSSIANYGLYPSRCLSDSDAAKFAQIVSGDEGFSFDRITRITYRGKTLYSRY